MSFDFENCWDCPVPLWDVVVQYLLSLLAGLAAQWLRYQKPLPVRGLGLLLLGCASLSMASWGLYIPRWGVQELGPIPFPIERVFFTSMAVAYFASLTKVGRRLRASQPSHGLDSGSQDDHAREAR